MRPLALAITAALMTGGITATAAPALAASTTYSVDCGAKDAGWGTTAHPWNSLAAVNEHGAFASGDRIAFRRGTTCGGVLSPSGDGTAGRPIVIGAYGSGAKPTIAGGGTGEWGGAVLLTDQRYWTIQDLHVTNTDGAATTPSHRSGVMLLNRSGGQLAGLTVQRLTVDHVVSSMSDTTNGSRSFGGISAITLPGLAGAGFSGLSIRDNLVDRVGRTGIITTNISYPDGGDTRPRITGNRVNHARGDGIVMLGARDGRIDHNVSSYANDEWPCPDCGGVSPRTANAAVWTGSSARVRVDHNEAYGTYQPGGDGEGFDVDISAVDAVVEYNYSHDNAGGGILICGSSNATIRFNIFENNGLGAFTFIGSIPADDTSISNNTVYISKAVNAHVVRSFGGMGGRGVQFFNNLVYNYGTGWYQWTMTPTTRSNTLVGGSRIGDPKDAGTRRTDPGLRDAGSGGTGMGSVLGYRPRSPKNDPRGVAIPGSVTTDYFGLRIDPKHPPRGAVG